MKSLEPLSCTILLDDAYSQANHPSSRLYQSPIQVIDAKDASELNVAFQGIESAIHQGQ